MASLGSKLKVLFGSAFQKEESTSSAPLPKIKKDPSRKVPAKKTAVSTKKHTLQRGETLSALALKYYGDAGEWQKIYEANKAIIGDDPEFVQVGQTVKIP